MTRLTTLVLTLCLAPIAARGADPHAHHHHGKHELPKAADAVQGASLYQLEMKLTDQQGRVSGADLFRGHPVVVAMFYGSCTTVCPLILADAKRVEQAVDPESRGALRFLFVSLDGARDTPAALAALSKQHGLDDARWRLTSTTDDSVQELAAVLGVRYKRLPDGNISHSALLTLLDGDGLIDRRVEGILQPVEDLAARVNVLAAGRKQEKSP